MDYEALIDEYNVCVVEQSGVMKKKTPEQVWEEQQREQRQELERQQLELLIFDAEAKTAEAEARVEAEVEAAEAGIETERAKFEKERASLEAKIKALELASAKGGLGQRSHSAHMARSESRLNITLKN
ncbi:hypothetical protein BS47DRAFT_1382185 [Hydnum rufescens UP504]|uniref:Uncharacterized protein n=1 Tax=Hydnum rufescens UP504 TaxID=1448309 RepID=A0A9P6AXS0_9AGAM|nr:hypothetical protein BS47DRAFT_1382185 [Hydnum rufescens UP504]